MATVNEDVEQLTQAYINEKCAPIILPYEEDKVSLMMNLITSQEDHISNDLSADDQLRPYYELELERVRWLVRAYLRVRLHKINTNVMSILDSPELAARLSDAELNYAKGYVTLIDAHMTSQMTDRLEQGPAEMRRLRPDELRKLTPTPNESTHVFCRVLEHIGAFDAGGESIELQAGDVRVLRYHQVEPLLLDERLALV